MHLFDCTWDRLYTSSLPVCGTFCLYVGLSACLWDCLTVCGDCLSVFGTVCLSMGLFVCLWDFLSVCWTVCLSMELSVLFGTVCLWDSLPVCGTVHKLSLSMRLSRNYMLASVSTSRLFWCVTIHHLFASVTLQVICLSCFTLFNLPQPVRF